jgi:hypothetical protein
LFWCVIPVPKLAKCTYKSANLLIVSFESQIYFKQPIKSSYLDRGTRTSPAPAPKPAGACRSAAASWAGRSCSAAAALAGGSCSAVASREGVSSPAVATRASASSSAATSRACARRGKVAQELRPYLGVRCSPGATTLSMERWRR